MSDDYLVYLKDNGFKILTKDNYNYNIDMQFYYIDISNSSPFSLSDINDYLIPFLTILLEEFPSIIAEIIHSSGGMLVSEHFEIDQLDIKLNEVTSIDILIFNNNSDKKKYITYYN